MKEEGMTTLGIGGVAEIFVDGVSVGKFHNVVTNACKQRFLRTLLQQAGDKIAAGSYAYRMGFSSGAVPINPESSGATSIEGTDTITVSGFTLGADSVYATLTGSWTNSTGSTVTINYIVCVYADDVSYTADLIYMFIPITATPVLNTQTITANYTLSIIYDT